MEHYISLMNIMVNIIQTIILCVLVAMIMKIWEKSTRQSEIQAQKVEEVKDALEVSSTTLAQEKTLKTLEAKTIIVGDKMDNLQDKVDTASRVL